MASLKEKDVSSKKYKKHIYKKQIKKVQSKRRVKRIINMSFKA